MIKGLGEEVETKLSQRPQVGHFCCLCFFEFNFMEFDV